MPKSCLEISTMLCRQSLRGKYSLINESEDALSVGDVTDCDKLSRYVISHGLSFVLHVVEINGADASMLC